jgi:protein pelota
MWTILQHADVAAVVMQEGLAHICLITSSMTLVRAKIDQCIPRKRKGNVQQHEKVSGMIYSYSIILVVFNFFYPHKYGNQ